MPSSPKILVWGKEWLAGASYPGINCRDAGELSAAFFMADGMEGRMHAAAEAACILDQLAKTASWNFSLPGADKDRREIVKTLRLLAEAAIV